MANLMNFVWSGLKPRMKIDIWRRPVKLGDGEVNELSPLYLKVTGNVAGIVSGAVEIWMDNERSPSGTCKIKAPTDKEAIEAAYTTEGGRLKMRRVDKIELEMYGNDSKWTWVGTSLGWFGIWPQGQEMTEGIAPHEQK